MEKAYKSGNTGKDNINKGGYNSFLEISNSVKASINQDKINEDGQRDGLKGCLTNTEHPANEVYGQYSGLWHVERAFRITKGTLELRPMFHFTPKRIEAHVCICFVAYRVCKELERILQLKGINIGADKVLDIAKTVTALKIKQPPGNETLTKTVLPTKKHRSIALPYDENFRKNLQGVPVTKSGVLFAMFHSFAVMLLLFVFMPVLLFELADTCFLFLFQALPYLCRLYRW